AGVGVRRADQGQAGGQVRAADACGRASRGVRRAVVGHAVGRDNDRGVGLGDAVVDGTAGVIVIGAAGDAPGVAIVAARVGVRGAAQGQTGAEVRSADACRDARRRAGTAIVSHVVGRDDDRGVGLGDADQYAAALVEVI